jgi:hypothetical protein
MAKKGTADERKVQEREDEEVVEPEREGRKRKVVRKAKAVRKEQPDGRRDANKKPVLGYQGKCILNPTGQPRFGKG